MDADCASREPQKQDLAIEVLRATGKVRFLARGYSMLPTLWPGDLLTVETVPFEKVSPGDVVLYQRWERLFMHRVMRRASGAAGSERPSLVTRGDSMTGFDAPVFPGELLGRVVSVQRTSGLCFLAPRCSVAERVFGLMLGSSDRLRSVALRWHDWRTAGMRDSGASPSVNGQALS